MPSASETQLDEAWRPVAIAARECTRLLGYPVPMLRCMPREDQAGTCPGNVAMHAGSYLTVIQAIVDHQLARLRMPEAEHRRIYDQALTEISRPR
jgi:hypothetical protein